MIGQELLAMLRSAGVSPELDEGDLTVRIPGFEALPWALREEAREYIEEILLELQGDVIESRPTKWRRHGPTTWLAEASIRGLDVDGEPVTSGLLALEHSSDGIWWFILRRVGRPPAALGQHRSLRRVLDVADSATRTDDQPEQGTTDVPSTERYVWGAGNVQEQ